mgnify:CR=1 FL=1
MSQDEQAYFDHLTEVTMERLRQKPEYKPGNDDALRAVIRATLKNIKTYEAPFPA